MEFRTILYFISITLFCVCIFSYMALFIYMMYLMVVSKKELGASVFNFHKFKQEVSDYWKNRIAKAYQLSKKLLWVLLLSVVLFTISLLISP